SLSGATPNELWACRATTAIPSAASTPWTTGLAETKCLTIERDGGADEQLGGEAMRPPRRSRLRKETDTGALQASSPTHEVVSGRRRPACAEPLADPRRSFAADLEEH